MLKKKSAPKYIKEAPEYNKGGYNHLEEEVGPASEKTLSHVADLYKYGG
jgi:hypothetical protein